MVSGSSLAVVVGLEAQDKQLNVMISGLFQPQEFCGSVKDEGDSVLNYGDLC